MVRPINVNSPFSRVVGSCIPTSLEKSKPMSGSGTRSPIIFVYLILFEKKQWTLEKEMVRRCGMGLGKNEYFCTLDYGKRICDSGAE